MALKKYCIIALVAIMAMLLPVGSSIAVAQEYSPGLHTGWMMELAGNNITYNRTYEYYIPTSYTGSEEVPLLFSFHGLGSSGVEQIDLTKFDVLAEREGFIAVFPDATVLDPEDYPEAELPQLPGAEIQWNLGEGSLQYYAGIDDVGFVSDMIAWFETNYEIDASRIYSTGMSDGALFSYLLAFNLTDTFAGIAPVCGPMPWGFGNPPTSPITVILMHGTADPILAYDGYGGMGGNVTYSVDETIAYWLDVDGITSEPVTTVWSDDAIDPTTITRYVYSGGTAGTQVILFKVEGCKTENYVEFCAGHTWPGGPQYAAPLLIGLVSNQIDGSGQIWKYLPPVVEYYLRITSTYGGEVSNSGGSVTVPGEGSFFYAPGTPIQEGINLVATPKNVNYEFTGWTGDTDIIDDPDAATTTITFTPNRDYQITANFQDVSEPSGGCFIATAAYGTSTAEQLDVLREFRDDVLLKSTVGSRLVDLYYQVSPPIADFISEHSFVRTLVRELLVDPIVWLVEATGDIWQN